MGVVIYLYYYVIELVKMGGSGVYFILQMGEK